MTEKAKMQQIIAEWKSQTSDSDKQTFLEKIKAEVDAKSGEELLTGVKAIGELAQDLHAEVMQSAPSASALSIEVFPADAAERQLLENLLSKMNIRYKAA